MTKMKKIALLTFHNTCNYGATLQAYALQKATARFSDSVVLDYDCKPISDLYNPKKLPKSNRFVKRVLKYILMARGRKRCYDSFAEFTKAYIPLSAGHYTRENVRECVGLFDKFIAGSDQIWNFSMTGNDSAYFLDFVGEREKKYSYAASFGFTDNFERNKDKYVPLLQSLGGVSVRENIGVNEITQAGITPHIHIDPSLLLTDGEWEKLLPARKCEKKYILIYTVLSPNKLISAAKTLSQITGLELIYLNNSYFGNQDIKHIRFVSPCDFLWYIKNAEYVFTTSFHGAAFSVLFRKRFFTELDEAAGGKHNARVEHLLKTLGLSDRDISKVDIENDYLRETDWVKTEEKLNEVREKSLAYLRSIIDE